METNVTVDISVVIPIDHPAAAVETFIEKIAGDAISDILNNANKKIEIRKIGTHSKGLIQG